MNAEDDVRGHVPAVVCSRGGVVAPLVTSLVRACRESGVAHGTGVRAAWLGTLRWRSSASHCEQRRRRRT